MLCMLWFEQVVGLDGLQRSLLTEIFLYFEVYGRSNVKHVKDNYMNVLEIRLKSGKEEGLGCCLTNCFVFVLNFV